MDELEEIRAKKLEKLKSQLIQNQFYQNYQKRANQEKQIQQFRQIERLVKLKFTKTALERYSNLKIAHPEKAYQLIIVLSKFIDKVEKINDEQIKNVLRELIIKQNSQKIKRK